MAIKSHPTAAITNTQTHSSRQLFESFLLTIPDNKTRYIPPSLPIVNNQHYLNVPSYILSSITSDDAPDPAELANVDDTCTVRSI